MTFLEAQAALQLLAEERVGSSSRRVVLEQKAREDAAVASVAGVAE